jgi:glutamine synthetase type III
MKGYLDIEMHDRMTYHFRFIVSLLPNHETGLYALYISAKTMFNVVHPSSYSEYKPVNEQTNDTALEVVSQMITLTAVPRVV